MTRYKQTNNLKPIDAAYIAGLVDGEGTITLGRRHKNENRQLVVAISNNDRSVLEYVLEITGVGIVTRKRTYRPNHAISLTYKLTNRQALSFLRQITPYLKTYKRLRALLVLEKYLELTPRNGKYSRQLKKQRNDFISEFFEIIPNFN